MFKSSEQLNLLAPIQIRARFIFKSYIYIYIEIDSTFV